VIRRSPRWASCTGPGALLCTVLALYVALHLLEPRLSITWSYAHLWRTPALGWLGVVLTLALPPATLAVWRHPALAKPLSALPTWQVVATAACLLGALGYASLRHPSHPTTIDPPLYVIAISRGEVNARHMLTTWSLGRLAGALRPWMAPASVILLMSAVYGTVTYLALAASARRLVRTRGEALALTLLSCSAFGVVQMSFGVSNSRSVALAIVSVFCWTAFRALDRAGSAMWPFVIGISGPFWYNGLILVAPSVVVLAAELLRRPGGRRQVVVGIVAGLACAGLATVPVYGAPFAWATFLRDAHAASSCELGVSPTSCLLPPSYIFTARHALEVLNVWVLTDGVGLLLIAVTGTWLAARLVTRREWDPKAAILAPIVAGALAFSMAMDNLFGNFANWDVFSYGAAATGLLGGYAFVTWGRECRTTFRLVLGLALAAAGVHLLARLNAMHLDLQFHIAESPPPGTPLVNH